MLLSTMSLIGRFPSTVVDSLDTFVLMLALLFASLFYYALIADEYDGKEKDNNMAPMYQNGDILLQENKMYVGKSIPTHIINSTWGKILLIVLALIIITSYPSYTELALYK